MASSLSNDNGRALEYCLANVFQENYINTSFYDQKTIEDQERDFIKFNWLSDYQKIYFERNCLRIVNWVKHNRIFEENGNIQIQRLTDNDAKKGNPTDISIWQNGNAYNISLKHNHYAVKHQRPGGLYNQLGVDDDLAEKNYRGNIKNIENQFFKNVEGLRFSKFNQVKEYDSGIIDRLYENICFLVKSELDRRNQPQYSESLFYFLVGNQDFDKFIVREKEVGLMSFYNIPSPRSFMANTRNSNYLYIHFDNGYKFSLRLHTASSGFDIGKSLSLKFDTQLVSEPIDYILI